MASSRIEVKQVLEEWAKENNLKLTIRWETDCSDWGWCIDEEYGAGPSWGFDRESPMTGRRALDALDYHAKWLGWFISFDGFNNKFYLSLEN